MMIHEITAVAGKYKRRKRVGRGESSGQGKTSGRGHKGARARAGYKAKRASEGGQMPYFRRISKLGFTNVQFKTEFWIVNLGDLLVHPMFARGGEVNAARLVAAGLIRDQTRPLKVLGDLGTFADAGLKVKLTINAQRVSAKVKKLVIDAGGTVNELGTRRDRVRGVDRNSGDPTPKNLDKKPKRRAAKKFDTAKPAAAEAPAEGGAESPAPAKPKGQPKAAKEPKGEGKGKGDGAKGE